MRNRPLGVKLLIEGVIVAVVILLAIVGSARGCEDGEPRFYYPSEDGWEAKCWDPEADKPGHQTEYPPTLTVTNDLLYSGSQKWWSDVVTAVEAAWGECHISGDSRHTPVWTIVAKNDPRASYPFVDIEDDVSHWGDGVLGDTTFDLEPQDDPGSDDPDDKIWYIINARILLNTSKYCFRCNETCLSDCGSAPLCPAGKTIKSAYSVMVHEFGHLLGFYHPENDSKCDNVMDTATAGDGDCDETHPKPDCPSFGNSDIAGVEWLYDPDARPASPWRLLIAAHGERREVRIEAQRGGRGMAALRVISICSASGAVRLVATTVAGLHPAQDRSMVLADVADDDGELYILQIMRSGRWIAADEVRIGESVDGR